MDKEIENEQIKRTGRQKTDNRGGKASCKAGNEADEADEVAWRSVRAGRGLRRRRAACGTPREAHWGLLFSYDQNWELCKPSLTSADP
ncbi:hypothetical protein E2C01_098128 [Portunus trituberculatus]|uniref:Uncharacterized protein n=1 Tax=Portunus trituberculatus TaxID=210409 RepID=A0A5B7KC37_PORTR|nr:hypothetical protein [Portunus trituberculatus]